MASDLGFYLTSINQSKKNVMRDDPDADASVVTGYPGYIINKLLSYHQDSVLIVTKKKRFSKLTKVPVEENVELLKEYYGYSTEKAMEVVTLHTEEDFRRIRDELSVVSSVKNSHLNDMVEIVLTKPDNFLILKETLTRIGVPNKDNTKLYQTCHILCKKKKYYIVHFKEMFLLDGRPSSMNASDTARRNSVINYLLDRKFFTLANGQTKLEPSLPHTAKNDDFTIITHSQKKQWQLIPKYVIGNPANKSTKKKKAEPEPKVAEAAALTTAEPVLS